ncbi:hypothetical protein GF337_03195, partial [candidate division KSB1 bacterium]|nr:hypothetical protein [candidate division KSB1 bacterium]
MKINKSVNPLPLIILIIALTKLTGLQGKAIYVDGKLSDDNGNGSLQYPKKYITSGIRLLASGDTLIIEDGVYKGQSNIIHQSHRPANGTAGRYTVIKARNMGKVYIDGEYLLKPVEIGNLSYIVFNGIIFCQSSETNFTLVDSDHIKIIRCGFCDANNTPTQRANHILMRYCEYVLLEDCFTWGTAKYRFYVLDSKFIILRRCLDRFDRGIDNGPYSNLASYRIYGSNNVLLQNCISIDADADLILNNNNGDLVPADPKLLFIGGNPSTNNRSEDNLIEGCIFLNCKSNGWIGFGGKDMSSNNTIRNSVFWDLNGSFWTRGSSTTAYVNHCTIGNIQYENNSHDRAIESDFSGNVEVYNSIIYNTGSEALRNVRSNYNVLFDNYKNYSGTAVGYNDICTENNNAIDPIDGSPGNGSPALKYLLKIEAESDLANTSSENSNSGATIIKKIGISGTLFGEDGYNRLTDESLWPWENEHIIKNLLQKYHYDDGKNTISGKRGFCADNQTLTNYIWGYLGNEPPDFYPPYLNFDNLSPEPDAMAVDVN